MPERLNTMDSSQDKFDLIDKALTRNLRWIAAADTRVPPIFAIDAAMLGALAALAPPVNQWSTLGAIVSFLAGSALVASIICLAVASFPRLKGPKGSIVYFGSAITRDEADYIRMVSKGPSPELIEDMARQAYRNAEIAKSKFTAIKWSMILLFGSMPVWLISVALLYQARSTPLTP